MGLIIPGSWVRAPPAPLAGNTRVLDPAQCWWSRVFGYQNDGKTHATQRLAAAVDDLSVLPPDWRTRLRARNVAPSTIPSFLRVGENLLEHLRVAGQRNPLYREHGRTAATCEACAHAEARADGRRAPATRKELHPFPEAGRSRPSCCRRSRLLRLRRRTAVGAPRTSVRGRWMFVAKRPGIEPNWPGPEPCPHRARARGGRCAHPELQGTRTRVPLEQ
jgi:hypothetical protein